MEYRCTLNLNTVELLSRNVHRSDGTYGQSKRIERSPDGGIVSESDWKDTGGCLFYEEEVSCAVWYKPWTWGDSYLVRRPVVDIDDYR